MLDFIPEEVTHRKGVYVPFGAAIRIVDVVDQFNVLNLFEYIAFHHAIPPQHTAAIWHSEFRFVALFFAGDEMARQSLAPFDHLRSEAFLSELRASGVPAESVSEFTEQVASARDAIAVVFPAVWIIGAAVLVIANAGLLRLYLLRKDPGWLEDGEFERVRFPLALVAAFILAGAAVAVPVARPAAYNVLLVVAFFFALQGLAVVASYARRLAAPPLLRAAVLVLVLANPWAPQILALLGLFDNWFDFRRWAEPPREKS